MQNIENSDLYALSDVQAYSKKANMYIYKYIKLFALITKIMH